jgi:hypothetical protein
MKLSEFKTQLGAHPAAHVVISLPGGGTMPRHFHVTEVGHVARTFVDCGGKFRAVESCVLQTWTASEYDDGHRLTAGKLQFILGLADSILPSGELPVEVEFEDGVISQFPVDEISFTAPDLTLHLGSKHTDCLARERCGVKDGESCAAETGAEACCGSSATGSDDRGCR